MTASTALARRFTFGRPPSWASPLLVFVGDDPFGSFGVFGGDEEMNDGTCDEEPPSFHAGCPNRPRVWEGEIRLAVWANAEQFRPNVEDEDEGEAAPVSLSLTPIAGALEVILAVLVPTLVRFRLQSRYRGLPGT